MRSDRISMMRFNLRQDVKMHGRAKTRARALFYLAQLDSNPQQALYAADYRQACRDVLGGEF